MLFPAHDHRPFLSWRFAAMRCTPPGAGAPARNQASRRAGAAIYGDLRNN
ncbi:MAG: hypothetical protein ACYCVZ_00300 [Streptosporangiaceae bacterium]